MMRRSAIGIGAAGVVLALSAVVLANGGGTTPLSQYSTNLNKAAALSVSFTTRSGDDAPMDYSVTLQKPNKARIDTPSKLIVADGTNVTTYYKDKNSYIVSPQGGSDLKALLKSDELVLFAPFFDAGALNTAAAKDLGQKQLGGSTVDAVEVPLAGTGHTATAYLTQQGDSLKSAQISLNTVSGMSGEHTAKHRIIVTRSFSVTAATTDDTFVFKAPDNSKQITLADLSSDKWYTDLDEAMQVAKQTNRKIFVDFDATWCGPCHMLHDEVLATDQFKALSKYFVFCEIDVDAQPTIAANYQVDAMPTQMVLDANGSVIDKTVGYGGPDAFYAFINKYAN